MDAYLALSVLESIIEVAEILGGEKLWKLEMLRREVKRVFTIYPFMVAGEKSISSLPHALMPKIDASAAGRSATIRIRGRRT